MSVISQTETAIDFRAAIKAGIIGGGSAMFIAAIGMLSTFAERNIIDPILTMGYMILLGLPLLIGYLIARPRPAVEGLATPTVDRSNVLTGLLSGFIAGVTLVLFILFFNLFDQASLREIFINITAEMYAILTFHVGLVGGSFLLIIAFALAGGLGALIHLLPEKWLRPITNTILWVLGVGVLTDVISQILRQIGLRDVGRFLFENSGGLSLVGAIIVAVLAFAISYYQPGQRGLIQQRINKMEEEERRRATAVGYFLLALFILLLPFLIGNFLSEVLDLVGIFAIMALGLNIVLGYAGMLDLGYVAFFAVGAYTVGVLTSTNAPGCQGELVGFCPEINFWLTIPFVMIMAAIAGVIVGAPVIRMRGDYLAIVTLGFGEIARLIIQSDWFQPVLGAALGIRSIPTISIPFITFKDGPTMLELTSPPEFFYPILGFVLFSIYALWRLQGSRIGRAWMALREDERVAEVMGINIVSTKLLAFVTGAVLASFSGALFASKIGSIFPNSFNIEKSIQVLIIVIVGGLGSIPGMVAASFLIIGVPELLREFDEYRFLIYGVLLVVMMLYRPEGLIPNRRIAHVLTDEEATQDAWLDQQQTDADISQEEA